MYLIALIFGIILGSLPILSLSLFWISILGIIVLSLYYVAKENNYNKAFYSLIGYALAASLSNIYIFAFALILLISAALIDYYNFDFQNVKF